MTGSDDEPGGVSCDPYGASTWSACANRPPAVGPSSESPLRHLSAAELRLSRGLGLELSSSSWHRPHWQGALEGEGNGGGKASGNRGLWPSCAFDSHESSSTAGELGASAQLCLGRIRRSLPCTCDAEQCRTYRRDRRLRSSLSPSVAAAGQRFAAGIERRHREIGGRDETRAFPPQSPR